MDTLPKSILQMRDTLPKSILQMRDSPLVYTGVNPTKDLDDFTKMAESRRQESNDAVEKAKFANNKWIDFSQPIKTESTLSQSLPKGKLPKTFAGTTGAADIEHDWKIFAGTEADTWIVGEGDVYFVEQGGKITVPATTLSGTSGKIYLKVSRDASSRAGSAPVPELAAEVPASTESSQYFELGEVPSLNQKQFTPIRVYEDLFVVNGEFMLGNLAIFGDNFYPLPTT